MIKHILGRLPRSSKPPKSEVSNNEADGGANTSTASASLVMHNRLGAKDVRLTPFPVCSGADTSFEPLPSFRDVPSSERPNLFIRKLDLCCVVFDFSDASKNVKEKEIKRQTLVELVDYVGSCTSKFSEFAMEEVARMVARNIFRTLLPLRRHEASVVDSYDAEDEEQAMEPSWPHLQLVYELFLRFIVSSEVDPKICKRYVKQSFIHRLMGLFDSEDFREREYLKTILHRVYGKYMSYRPFIRRTISHIFYRFIFETEKHNGIAELLEILSSIINGYALPVKEEHKLFLVRALIPLHKPTCVSAYHRQLNGCIIQFVEKDFKLADTIIRGLLKYWPITNSHKEVLFLNELEEVLELTQPAEFQRCMVPLFKRIGQSLNSPHFQVAERALFLWNNDHIVNLVAQNRAVIIPLVFAPLEKNIQSHWNQAVHSLTLNVRKILVEMDQELFLECKRKFEEDKAKKIESNERRQVVWQRLEALALSNQTEKPKEELLLLKNRSDLLDKVH
ncbi:hypothetical protein GOP47_0023566 [Adiantum capillus-veneris]|uniref:Serine/threonine protein phosphatase 2A regulatory subunit n=1 Tax=Adiantum capillus-veneris TaxID=13818 RepID=A0A9D4Z617_ADICA|nr:hypothetical protein GOP47_0023566 [Adiantum capillus-veneris]